MPTIHAWQHIYSNVEKAQSPHGRGGFQTLFYTHSGLSEDGVSEMEGRLLYFPSQIEPVKRLFFTLTSGHGVVAQIVPLPEPDQLGRKGRYLAHSLVFSPESLALFEADPFRVFRCFRFVTTVAEALAAGNFQTGDLPAASLDLPAEPNREIETAKLWPAAEFKKLALLALQADRQARDREIVTFTGEPSSLEPSLAAAFLAVPAAARARCTFDTYFYRCNPVAAYFWAAGLPEPPVSIKFALVDPQARRVQGTIPEPQSAYEHWTLMLIETGQLPELVRQRDDAWVLGAWLDGQADDSARLNSLAPELVTAVFHAAPDSVQKRLRHRLGEVLPEALVSRAAAHIYGRTAALPLYGQLRQGWSLPQLLDTLYESYAAEKFKEPAREEIKGLNGLLEQNGHELLRLCLAYWRNPKKDLPAALDRASEAVYRQFGAAILPLNLVEPLSLLRRGRGQAFLNLYLPNREVDLIELSEALLEAGEASGLAQLTGYVAKLSGKELKQLTQVIDDQPDVPAAFITVVEQAVAAQPPEEGFKGLLRAVWRRLPGQD
ncbi:MAG: hypothetical protein U0401_06895 [Anaerolineae bacterium]